MEPMIDGSYEETGVPAPNVDSTNPDAPAPAPPAPALVPPAPAPGAPVPNPPTPPPGVPCTTPAFTPRNIPPACVRRISVFAIGRLYRAIARSRLFSRASWIASLRDKYNLPSRISWISSGELVRSGCGTAPGAYAREGLRDLGMSKLTVELVCPDAVAVTPMRNQDTNRAK